MTTTSVGSTLRRIARAVRRRVLDPRVGEVDFGDLRRTDPIGRQFGFDRGTPIDRIYIEHFLSEHAPTIRGVCLEVADRTYTERFGAGNVTRSDVLHATGETSETTIVGDLTHLQHVASGTYDCVVLTQTLQFIYDIDAAVEEVHRILRPGGTCLCTMSFITQVSRYDMDRWGEYWRLTDRAALRLFGAAFDGGEVIAMSCGNVLAATALMHGMAAEELTEVELAANDPDYPVVVCVRATKASA